MRSRLLEITQGSKDEFIVKKLFQEFDQNNNGFLSAYDLDLMMKKLDAQTASHVVAPALSKIDRNESGYIELEDFKKFLYHDPYPL